MNLYIFKEGNKKLTEPTFYVGSPVSAAIFVHIKNMCQLLTKHNGLALAANQVGLSYRFFVTHPDLQSFSGLPKIIFNPSFVGTDPKDMDEGCLSIPKKMFTVPRFNKVTATFQILGPDNILVYQEKHLEGIVAQVFQHECDHLSGILISSKGTLLL